MTCIDKDGIKKSYMKYAFDRSAHGALFATLFYEDLMEEDSALAIDVNSASYTAAEKAETVLDYIDKLIMDKRNHSAAFIK